MIYLLASILCSGSLGIFFKFFEKKNVEIKKAIFVNYLTCTILGVVLTFNELQKLPLKNWMIVTLIMGLLFIVTLELMAQATKKSGISAMVISNKMSLIFPVSYGLIILGERVNWLIILGIFSCLLSVYLITKSPKKSSFREGTLLLIVVFFLSGTIDVGITFLETHFFTNNTNFMLPTLFIFGSAAFWGLPSLFKSSRTDAKKKSTVFLGILLGIPNFFSIYFLFLSLRSAPFPSSILFPINNMGVILVGFMASLLFKEKLYSSNYWGVLLALFAIGIMAIGSQIA